MKINITKKIGKSNFTFQIDAEKDIDALFEAGTIASIPNKCSLCKSFNVCLSGNKANGYTFVKVKCEKCFAQAGLGQYKDGGHFWKQFEKYESKKSKKG